MNRPRVVFMGTPAFAVPALRAVAGACDVALVVTGPDRQRGRGRSVTPSAVAVAAEELKLEISKSLDMRSSDVASRLRGLAPDLFAVVAFGAILSPELLAVPRLGAMNLHASILPEYRGAAPVQRALWDGRAWTGVTTLWMDEGIDTGDCVLQRWTSIEPNDHAGTLAARLSELGGPLLVESLLLAQAGEAPRRPQPKTGGSYAPKLEKRDGRVDWAHDAVRVWHHQRAVTPWPGALTGFADQRLLLTQLWPHHLLPLPEAPGTVVAIGTGGIAVACGTGVALVTRVKPEAKAEMTANEWARGVRLSRGDVLGIEKEAHA